MVTATLSPLASFNFARDHPIRYLFARHPYPVPSSRQILLSSPVIHQRVSGQGGSESFNVHKGYFRRTYLFHLSREQGQGFTWGS